jgi:AcrR family transcriptional regulator
LRSTSGDDVLTRTKAKPARRAANKRPGRPEGNNGNFKEAILDAAELVFAEHGYGATSLREIASRAHVTQALITYYYASKLQLYEQVFLRRGRAIGRERAERLAALQESGKAVPVRKLVEAFLEPAISQRKTPGGRAFLQLQARLNLEPREISNRLRDEAYTKSTEQYVRALRKAIPKLSAKDAWWRLISLIGAYLYAVSDGSRIDEYAPGICNPEDPDEILDEVTRFVVGGFKAD